MIKNRLAARRARRPSSLVRSAVESLEGRQLLAAVSWDGGAGTSNWTDVLNWSTNSLPQPGDDVTISVATNPTIVLNGANAVINSLTSDEALNLNSGTLSVAAASSSAAGATVTQGGAMLAGAGTFSINGPLVFSGGTMGGSGTTIAKGATTIGSGGAYSALTDTRTLRIEGSATLATAGGYTTNVDANARLRVASGGTLTHVNAASLVGAGALIIDAGGTLTRTAVGTGVVALLIQNSGTISATGTAILDLYNTATTGGTFAGNGRIDIEGGTHTFANATTASSLVFNVMGGTIDGAGTLTVNGPFNWTSGIMQGTGTVELRGTSTIGSGGGYTYLRGSRTLLVTAGATTINTDSGYTLSVAADARLTAGNGGTIVAGTAATSAVVNGDAGNGTGAVNVEAGGVLTRLVAGTGTINIPVNNLGTLDADGGNLNLLGGGTNAAAATPAAGATVGLGGSWAHNDNTTFSGDGTVLMYSGTHTVNDGPAASTINVASGTTLAVDNGTVAGPGVTHVDAGATYQFRRGFLQGTGTTTVLGTAVLGSGNGYAELIGSHTLRIRGTASFGTAGGYHFSVGTNGRLVAGMGGTIDLTSTGDLRLVPVAATNVGAVVVEPGGTLTRTAAGIEYIDIPVQNIGGTIRASAGAILIIDAGSTHAAGSTFAGPGIVRLGSGAHLVNGATDVAVGGNLELYSAAAVLNGTSTLTVNGAIALVSGTLGGSATTLVNGTASVGSGNGYVVLNNAHQLRIAGAATHTTAGGYDVRVATDARIAIANGGTYNFGASAGSMRLLGVAAANTGLLVVEAGGTLTRTFAGGESIDLPVQSAGTIRAGAGSDLGISAGSTQLGGATIDGPGNVHFNGGTHTVSGAATVAVGGRLIQSTGTINGAGTLTVEGTYNFNSGAMAGTGTTVLRGTTSTLGSGSGYTTILETRTVRVEGTATVSTASGYDLRLAAGAKVVAVAGGTLALGGSSEVYGAAAGNVGTITVEPLGTLVRSVGGTATIGVSTNNFGTVRIDASTILFSGPTNADDGTFLSSGQYRVNSGGNLAFSPNLTTLTADVELSGTATASGLSSLAINRGRIGLTDGADLSVDPAAATRFRLEGILDLSPASVFTAVGGMDLGGTSQPVVRSEISSPTNFGRVVVTGGSLDLNSPDSTSRFDPDLVGGYDPAVGTQFAILTAPSRINTFDNIQGGLTPSNNVLGASLNATTYGARVIPGPAPAAPQILSSAYEFETRQAVTFNFDQDVSAFLSRKDYTIMNLTTGQPLPQSAGTLSFNAASNQATLTLTNQLPDGNYRLTVNAGDIANNAGVAASGAPVVLNFFVLAGDANRDRTVNFADLVIIAQNYNQTGKTFGQGNFNYSTDGSVNFADLVLLAQRYNTSVAAPATVAASLTTAGTKSGTRNSRNALRELA